MSGVHEALLYETLKAGGQEQRFNAVFSRMSSFGLLGLTVAAPLGSLIAVFWGLRETMLFSAVPVGLALGIIFTLKEHPPQKAIKNLPEGQKNNPKPSYWHIMKTGLRNYRTNHDLRRLTWDMLAIATASYFIIWTYQLRLASVNVPLVYFGLVHMGMLIVQIVVLNTLPRIEKRLKTKKYLLQVTALFTGIGFLACAIFDQLPGILFGIFLTAAFGLSRGILMANVLNRKIPSEQRATMLSVVNMFRRLTLMVLNPFMGMMIEKNLLFVLVLLGACTIAWSIFTPLREKYLTPD